MCKTVLFAATPKYQVLMSFFCMQLQVLRNQVEDKRIAKPVYLITNLAYQLKPHHSRNMYLQARLDTCDDVNIMPASVYHLIFKDPGMKKITPCKMQIGTYMADTVKIVGSCTFYVVHADSKKLIPVTFLLLPMIAVYYFHARPLLHSI